MDRKHYQDEFCVNAASPCVADYCPCVEYPGLCRYYQSTHSNLKEKRKSKQLPGQIDVFDSIENVKENNND